MMLFAYLLLVASLAYMLVLGYALSRARSRANTCFMLVLLISMVWDLTYFFELTEPDPGAKVIFRLVRLQFLPWLAFLWLRMSCLLFGIGKWIPRFFWWLAAAFNVVVMGLAATAPWHDWFLHDFQVSPIGPLGILTYARGPLYVLYEAWQYLLSLFSLGLMITALLRSSPGLRRRNLVLMITGFSLPMFLTMAFSYNKSPVPHLNLGPFTTVISIGAFAWVVLRNRALDLIPLARTMTLDHLPDPVLVLDAEERVADLNLACSQVLGQSPRDLRGQSAGALPQPWRGSLHADAELVRHGEGEATRWYDRTVLPVLDEDHRAVGRIYVWRNVSIRHRVQLALSESENQLRTILNSIAEAVFIHTPDGVVRFVNRPVLKLYGLAGAEDGLRHNIFTDYSAPNQDWGAARARVERALAGEDVVVPCWRARRPVSGECFDVRVVLQRIFLKETPLLLATVTDLTVERQERERALAYQKMMQDKQHLRQMEWLVRDLHDGVGGILAGIGMLSEVALRSKAEDQRATHLRQIADLAGEGNVEVRSLMNTLETRDFFWADLITELRRHGAMMQDRHGIAFGLQVEGEGDPGGPGLFAGMSLFRIVKEALNNVVKHAGATRVEVTLSFASDRLSLVVADNGRGLGDDPGTGRGLRNMRQRISELSGEMTLASGAGLVLTFTAPLPLRSPAMEEGASDPDAQG